MNNSNEKLNILLTSVGRRSYLVEYFKRALDGNGEVHVSNSSENSPAFQVADRTIVTPFIYDDNYIPFLLDYCINNNIKAIISLFDIDLPILSKNKDKFDEIGVNLIISEPKVICICNDKWNSYNFLKNNGINVPNTYLSLEEVNKGIENGDISFPIIVKPRWGMGSIGVYEAETKEELKVFFEKAKRNIKETYLKYESSENIEECVLLQEKIVGEEYGLDIINNLHGEYQNTIVKRKLAMRSGETDCAITVDNMDIRRIGERISSLLKHIGNLDVDVFVENNKIYVLEMNARFGGGYPFSHMAGVNLPLAIVKWLTNSIVDEDLLNADIEVMCHKDINLVRL